MTLSEKLIIFESLVKIILYFLTSVWLERISNDILQIELTQQQPILFSFEKFFSNLAMPQVRHAMLLIIVMPYREILHWWRKSHDDRRSLTVGYDNYIIYEYIVLWTLNTITFCDIETLLFHRHILCICVHSYNPYL